MTYNEEDVCCLEILDCTEADEAEYTCKASNSLGEVEYSGELIVIAHNSWSRRGGSPLTRDVQYQMIPSSYIISTSALI